MKYRQIGKTPSLSLYTRKERRTSLPTTVQFRWRQQFAKYLNGISRTVRLCVILTGRRFSMTTNMVSEPDDPAKPNLTTIQKIASSMTRKGQVGVMTLLYFAKAFNKVSHRRLLHKLHYYGGRDSTLRWNESFLSQRKQSYWKAQDPLRQTYFRVFHRAWSLDRCCSWHL